MHNKKTAQDLIGSLIDGETAKLRGQLDAEKQRSAALSDALERAGQLWGSTYASPKASRAKRTAKRYYTRVAVGDTHGCHIDIPARDAFLNDLEVLRPTEIVFLGDLLDCSGTFSRFKKQYLREFSYSYRDDVEASNDFLDQVQRRTPGAKYYYVEGNHERRIEAWAVERFQDVRDAGLAVDAFGPKNALHLDKRGVEYFSNQAQHMGLSVPGIIQLDKCFFGHGFGRGVHATFAQARKLGDNFVHGHNHRSMSYVLRTVDSTIGAWCPGCLCDLQPYFYHSDPTDHTHGYHVQFVDRETGWFAPWNVSVLHGISVLPKIKEVLR